MLTFTENPAEARDAIGIEVVTPSLVNQLAANIDPQHEKHKGLPGWSAPEGESAAAYVLKWTIGLPADQMNVFIEKPDLDSVCAAALLELERLGRIIGEGVREKVALIDEADRGGRGLLPWKPGEAFLDAGSHPDLRGMAYIIQDKLPLRVKVTLMRCWLSGLPSAVQAVKYAAGTAEYEMEDGRSHAKVCTYKAYCDPCSCGGMPRCGICAGSGRGPTRSWSGLAGEVGDIAVVRLDNVGLISRGRGACAIGYKLAPVVVAVCEDFAGRGWTGRKFTVAAHPGARLAGYEMNFRAFLSEVSRLENGWGGNIHGPGGIVGSPMAGPSSLSPDIVLAAVQRALLVPGI